MSIEVKNLSYVYMKGTPFERKALEDINIKIDKGEFVGIIGHTGSGKSTLVQHFNGLLKPTTGKVIVNGMDTSGKGLKELRRQVGIVFQYPEHQLFEETVYKDIVFGLKKLGIEGGTMDERIYSTLEIVGLDRSILYKSPFELSGGQKRRVAIAGVLVMEPEIIVLDEPAAGLDPSGRNEIFNFIKKLYMNCKVTVIIVSHNMEEIARLVNRVIVINKGRVEMDGPVKEIFRNTKKLESIGLSAPQVTYLMKELKKIFPGIDDNIHTVEEAKAEILRLLGRRGGDARA
ncbi:MAG: energy-coupling factor transporter ATPase [Clostridiaceae bacterium]|nr:energy-coupling factor transporter ATPase [Clostridiaceae bacterium]